VTSSRLRSPASGPALAAFGLIAVLAALTGAHALQAQVQARAERGATASARIIVSLVVARNIGTDEITELSLSVAGHTDMDDDVALLREHGQMLSLDVWSLTGGTVVYADDGADATDDALATLDPADLARARRGAFTADDAGAFTVFLPYDPDGGTAYTAVTEVRLPRDPIDRTVRLWTIVSYAGAGLAIALTLALIIFYRRRHRRHLATARRDALTGLGNRLLLTEATERVLGATGRPAALLLLDLDGFKEVNDTLGHDAGDTLLATVADRLREAGAGAEAVVRLGGDEFVVLIAGADADSAALTAEALRLALRRPVVVAGLPVEIDASIGVAVAPQHGTVLTTLLKRADVAMYEAKRTGAGTVVYDLSTDSRDAAHLSVLAELREGIAAGQLRLHYQPKCHPDGRIDEVEALVRWQHPVRGLLAPAEFVPLAERTSLIKPLTAWVLREAARQCGKWREQGRELTVAVNVSARNLLDDDLIATLTAAAADAGVPVQALRLEITETAVMTDPEGVNKTLRELAGLGMHVSIDDFGVGYTSLSYLSVLPVQALKIDRRFVTGMLTSPLDEVLVRNVIHLARDLGMDSVAEGVESAEVWQRLADLGCDEIQGYVLTRPLPPDDLGAWLDGWRPETGPAHSGVKPQDAVPVAGG
jgi:diguanylate cyclase (GGDEF)-like protein